MQHTTPSSSSTWLDARCIALLALALFGALGLALHGAIAQWPGYHDFADARGWLGLANAQNVLSNLPFLVVGLVGMGRLRTATGAARTAWIVFAAAITATAFGSSAYHWHPANDALAFDRLPIAWACAVLLCAFLAERVDARWSHPATLAAALGLATASVACWWLGERHGAGDLRPYVFVQFLPVLIIPAALCLRLHPQPGAAIVPDAAWWTVLGLYAAAKLMEMADHAVLDALAFTSGHTLKHLLAAAAAGVLLQAAAQASRAAQLR
jgi:hypothetical protein